MNIRKLTTSFWLDLITVAQDESLSSDKSLAGQGLGPTGDVTTVSVLMGVDLDSQ